VLWVPYAFFALFIMHSAVSMPSMIGLIMSPMAIGVIGGAITSTFLSLLVIPVLFTYVDDAVHLVKRPFQRRHTALAPQPAERPGA